MQVKFNKYRGTNYIYRHKSQMQNSYKFSNNLNSSGHFIACCNNTAVRKWAHLQTMSFVIFFFVHRYIAKDDVGIIEVNRHSRTK